MKINFKQNEFCTEMEELEIGAIFQTIKCRGVFMAIEKCEDYYTGNSMNAISLETGELFHFLDCDLVQEYDAELNLVKKVLDN